MTLPLILFYKNLEEFNFQENKFCNLNITHNYNFYEHSRNQQFYDLIKIFPIQKFHQIVLLANFRIYLLI